MADAQSHEDILRHHFLTWQCRIRQYAVRMQDGKPTPGMQAAIIISGQELSKLTVLINQKELSQLITEFSFMYRKTHDPAIRRDSLLKVLVAGYFQHAGEFSDRLTATLSFDSKLAEKLISEKEILLGFNQQNQQYKIPCSVLELNVEEKEFQATYWHNAIFNPGLPSTVRIIAFDPIWERAHADPLPNELNNIATA